MECRESCGACCIAPSVTRPFHGMPRGKPAGEACVHLDGQMRCTLFGDPRRPALCDAFRPGPDVCGGSREQALELLAALELHTAPGSGAAVP